MEQNQTIREWLNWLTRVRLLFIVLILAVGVVWPQYFPTSSAYRFFLPFIVLWITFGILELILVFCLRFILLSMFALLLFS